MRAVQQLEEGVGCERGGGGGVKGLGMSPQSINLNIWAFSNRQFYHGDILWPICGHIIYEAWEFYNSLWDESADFWCTSTIYIGELKFVLKANIGRCIYKIVHLGNQLFVVMKVVSPSPKIVRIYHSEPRLSFNCGCYWPVYKKIITTQRVKHSEISRKLLNKIVFIFWTRDHGLRLA